MAQSSHYQEGSARGVKLGQMGNNRFPLRKYETFDCLLKVFLYLFHSNNENGLKLFESNGPYLVLFSYQHNHYKNQENDSLRGIIRCQKKYFRRNQKIFYS